MQRQAELLITIRVLSDIRRSLLLRSRILKYKINQIKRQEAEIEKHIRSLQSS